MASNNNPRISELRKRAEAGDRFATAAIRIYKTDAQLEAAERLSRAQDFTDGGGWVDKNGRPLPDAETIGDNMEADLQAARDGLNPKA